MSALLRVGLMRGNATFITPQEMVFMAGAIVAVPIALCPIVIVTAESTDNPYIALGLGGVLLVAIVVPMFRWLMSRADKQQETQEKLIRSLQDAIAINAQRNDRQDIEHAQILERMERIEEVLKKRIHQ